jgi:hypothetical protein
MMVERVTQMLELLCDCGRWVEIPNDSTPVTCDCGVTYERKG